MQKFSGSSVVFVGNIPYDTTEASLIEIFKEVGPVSNFKINRDRDTGKPKGYGFCEFLDSATAASAVRNLDGVEFCGRQLRVAPADSDNNNNNNQNRQAQNMNQSILPQTMPIPSFLPNPIQEIKSQSVNFQAPATDVINGTLSTMSPPQIFELLTQINVMIQHSPGTARSFLTQNPQLCYALFKAMSMMNLIDRDLVVKTLGPQPELQRPDQRQMPRNQFPRPQQPGFNPTPTNFNRNQQFPPNPSAPAFQNQEAPINGDQQDQLIRRVMQMSQSEIDLLPMEQRQNVLRLKAQIMRGHN